MCIRDSALAYALINFIGTLAILKFFKFGNLGGSDPIDTQIYTKKSGNRP